MKKFLRFIVSIVALLVLGTVVVAQPSVPNHALRDFDKIRLENVNGQVAIHLGKAFGIQVEPPAALSQLTIEKRKDVLVIQVNKLGQADENRVTPVSISISMPEISKLYNFSNADVVLQNFVGRYLGCENVGNGNMSLNGTVVDFLEMLNRGNGNLDAKNLAAKKVNIQKQGNGDAVISTSANFEVTMDGNGDVVNFGTGKAVIRKQIGTGKVVYRP
jgi:hypothetical protein